MQINDTSPGEYCLVTIDIEHFKLFNPSGTDRRPEHRLLEEIGEHLKSMRQEVGGLAGYMGGDDFAMVLPNDPAILDKLQRRTQVLCVHMAGIPDSFRLLAYM